MDIIDTDRWGWSIGPLPEGYTGSFEIYAAAGQNDITKGRHVGNLLVTYLGETLTAVFQALPGFGFNETHLYVGSDPLPMKGKNYTISPGAYGNVDENLNWTSTWTVRSLF